MFSSLQQTLSHFLYHSGLRVPRSEKQFLPIAKQNFHILRFCIEDGISRAWGGRCFKPASGSVVSEGRGLNKHWNESKLPRRSDFSLSYFYFLYLYERGISGRGSLWWSRVCVCVCVCVYVFYKAIFSSPGRLTLLERRAWDFQLICFSNLSKFQRK